MKTYLDVIVVVEGEHDKSRVLSIFDAEVVVTNGCEIKDELINYLSNAKEYKRIVIFTDPDEEGKRIRNKLIALLPFAISIEADINKCNHKGKHGIAECELDEINNLLSPYKATKVNNIYCESDLYSYGLLGSNNSKNKRILVAKHFNLLNASTESFINSLNTLNINKDTLCKFLATI